MQLFAWAIGLFLLYLFYLRINGKSLNITLGSENRVTEAMNDFDDFMLDDFDDDFADDNEDDIDNQFNELAGEFDSEFSEFNNDNEFNNEFDNEFSNDNEFNNEFNNEFDNEPPSNNYSVDYNVGRKKRAVVQAPSNSNNYSVDYNVGRKKRAVVQAPSNNYSVDYNVGRKKRAVVQAPSNNYSVDYNVGRKKRAVSVAGMTSGGSGTDYTNVSDPLEESINRSINLDDDRWVSTNHLSSLLGPSTATVAENPAGSFAYSPFDDPDMNAGSVFEAFGSFAPGESATMLTPQMEERLMQQHRNLDYDDSRNEVNTMSRGYIKVENRPAGLQDFSKDLTPYSGVELERKLYPYTKPRYSGCYKNKLRRPVLPKYLGKKTVRKCAAESKALGHKVFGMGYGAGTGYGKGECRTGNDRGYARNGPAYDCELYGDNLLGGSESLAVYHS